MTDLANLHFAGPPGPGLSSEQIAQIDEAVDAAAGVLAEAGNITATSGETLPLTSSQSNNLNGAVTIFVSGRPVGFTIPTGQTGLGSYVTPRIPFTFLEAQRLAGSTIRIRTVMEATAGYLVATPFGGNAVRVDRQNGDIDLNEGTLLSVSQDGTKIVRDYSYVMVGDEAFVGPTHQIGANSATGAVRSFAITSLTYAVTATPALGSESGVDKVLEARLARLEPGHDIFPHVESIFQLANGADAIEDAGGRDMGIALSTGETGKNTILQWRYVLNGRERARVRGAQLRVTMAFDTSPGWDRMHTLNMQVRHIDLTLDNIVTSNVTDTPLGANRRVMSFTFLCPDDDDIETLQTFIALTDDDAATGAESIVLTDLLIDYYRVTSDTETPARATLALADERARSSAIEGAQATVDNTGKGFGARLAASDFASVQAALDAATLAAAPGARTVVQIADGVTSTHSLDSGDNVVMRGAGRGRTFIFGRLAANTAKATIQATSVLDFDGRQQIDGVGAYGRNCRYAFHIDAAKFKPDISFLARDCAFVHEGNDTADAYWGEPVWESQHGVAMGLCSGALYRFENVLARGPRAGLSAHNWDGFKDPAAIEIIDSELVATRTAYWALRLESIGARMMSRVTLIGNTLSGDVSLGVQPWMPTALADQPADHREFEIVGHGNSPFVLRNEEWGRALKIASATTGVSTSIAITGTAVPILFGTVSTVAGDTGMAGYAYGWADIQATTDNGRPGAITKLGARLGNRTGAPVTLTVTVNGGAPVNVNFAANYSAMTNAEVIALINAALGSAAVASEYNVGARYRPRITDEEQILQNNSGTMIFQGMALAFGTEGARTIHAMTNADPFSAFAGVALEDIRPNAYGRVKKGGWVALGDVLRSNGAVLVLGERFGIDPNKPGYVVSGRTDGSGILKVVRPSLSAGLETLAVEAVTEAASMAADVANLSGQQNQIVRTRARRRQFFGHATPVTGAAVTDQTFVLGEAADGDSYVRSIRLFALATGNLVVKVFSKSGDTFTQVGSDVIVPIKATGDITIAAPPFIRVDSGQYVGLYGPTILARNSVDALPGYWAPAGTGNLSTFTDSTRSTNPRIEIALDLGLIEPGAVDAGRRLDVMQTVVEGFLGLGENVQTIGEPAPAPGALGVVNYNYAFGTAVQADGYIKSVTIGALDSGPVRIKVWNRSADTFTEAASAIVHVVAGTFTYDFEDFGHIPVLAGQVLGVWPFDSNILSYDSETAVSGFYRSSGQTEVSTFVDASVSTNANIQINFALAALPAVTLNDVASAIGSIPLADGSDTLTRIKAKLATRLYAGTGIVKVMMIGDSWTEQPNITQQLKDMLIADYGESGPGWISCEPTNLLTGITHTRSGWTFYDGGGSGIVPPIAGIGCGLDGKAQYTAGTTAVASVAAKFQAFKLWYRDTTGTFRYRLDGGSWVVVAGGGTGAKLAVALTGLADAIHTIDIDTTGNAGTVVIYGYYATRTASGIEFNKCGNSSLDGAQWLTYMDEIDPFMADVAPDLMVPCIGTNDYRRSNDFATFADALTGVVGKARGAVPDVSIILLAPAASNGAAVTPLTSYVAAEHSLSKTLGTAFYNLVKHIGPFTSANALGQWFDSLHLSSAGGVNASKGMLGELGLRK